MAEPTDALPTCNSMWIGGDLGPISGACLASFVRKGHRVVLYSYDPPRDVPAGVEVADAAAVIPSSRIIRHKATGSYALFSNLFRYELIRQGRGIWIDCDVYCVRPIQLETPYVFGWQEPNVINGAILGLPSDAPVLAKLLAIFDMPSPVFPWLPDDTRSKLLARKLAGETFELGDLPWGMAGPQALSYLLTEAGLARHARPRKVFYSVLPHHDVMLMESGVDISPLIFPETLTVHLWHQSMSRHLDKMEPGSALDRLVREGTLFDETRLGIA